MTTTPATEHATLADHRLKPKEIAGLAVASPNAKFSSTELHRRHPYITKAAFDSSQTRMTT